MAVSGQIGECEISSTIWPSAWSFYANIAVGVREPGGRRGVVEDVGAGQRVAADEDEVVVAPVGGERGAEVAVGGVRLDLRQLGRRAVAVGQQADVG